MHTTPTMLDIDLQLFNGAAAGGAASAGDGGAAGTSQGDGTGTLPKADTSAYGSSRRRSGDLSNVVYGIQDEATSDASDNSSAAERTKGEGNAKADAKASKTPADMDAAFEELISGDYKEQFSKRVQDIINRRFKDSKNMEQQLASHQPVLDMMLKRYDIADGDMSALQKAIEDDNAFWEEIGDKLGYTANQARAQYKLEAENRSYAEQVKKNTEMQRAMMQQHQARQQYEAWLNEAKQVQQTHPKFNLDAEIKNPQFAKLIQSGVGLQHAYETVHLYELMDNATRASAQKAEQQAAAKVRQKAARPAENGTSSQGGMVYKPNASSWNAKDRAEIARRVARGENIKL